MYYGARGIVGLVKPTYRPGSMESFIRLMPEGVGFIPAHVGIRAGTEQEFQEALAIAERKVTKLAKLGANLVMIMGAPPAMVRGHGSDRQLAERLSSKCGVTVLTATIAQVEAFRALGIKKLAGITYFQGDLNQKFAKFLEHEGFEVAAMRGMDVPFDDAGKIPADEIYAFAKKVFVDASPVDGLYMLGAGWHNLPVIELLEHDLKTVVVSSIPAQVWATQKRLRIHAPVKGYGRLLAEMPD
jgi:maleate cis-trans isomerase